MKLNKSKLKPVYNQVKYQTLDHAKHQIRTKTRYRVCDQVHIQVWVQIYHPVLYHPVLDQIRK